QPSLSVPPWPQRPLCQCLGSPSACHSTLGALSGLVEARASSLWNWGCAQCSRASTSSGWVWAPWALHLERWLVPLAPGSEGLSTWTSSCRECTRSPSSASLLALCSNSHRASAASLQGRVQDLQPTMPEPSHLCCGLPRSQSLPDWHAPAPWRPVPSTAQRLRSAGMARDWWAAPPADLAWDPLGDASWAPESSGDLENLYV
uniref:Uncharacterized protein n=1 Tax=Macaca fascicularis TaxID=9541 RepID=A0A7N9CCV5_MACFA